MGRLFPSDGAQRTYPIDNARLIPSDGNRIGPIPLPENMGLLTGVYETLARDLSATRGVLVLTDGTAHVKGSYVELVASSSGDAVGIFFQGQRGSSGRFYMVDIAIGAVASEVIIVNNLAFYCSNSTIASNQYFIPLDIPSGTRISIRAQDRASGIASFDICANLLLKDDSIGLANCDTWGANVGDTTGTTITPSETADIKGSWIEIISSTPDKATIISIAQLQLFTGLSNTINMVDIGIGNSGFEEIILEDLPFETNEFSDFQNAMISFLPVDIPSGSRISARTQTDRSLSPVGSYFDIIIYGYR